MNPATKSPYSSTDRCPFTGAPSAIDNSAQQCTCSSPSNGPAYHITSTTIVSIGVISGIGVTVGRIRATSAGRTCGNSPEHKT